MEAPHMNIEDPLALFQSITGILPNICSSVNKVINIPHVNHSSSHYPESDCENLSCTNGLSDFPILKNTLPKCSHGSNFVGMRSGCKIRNLEIGAGKSHQTR